MIFDGPGKEADLFGDEASCAWVREEAAAYLLGALPVAGSDRIAEHRLLCGACDRALVRAAATTARLGLATPAAIPDPDVKKRLMAAVAREPRTQAPDRANADPPPAGSARANSTWRRPLAALAPLALLIAVLGGWAIHAQTQLGDSREDVARLERSNEAMSLHLGSLQAGQLAFGGGASSFEMTNVDESALYGDGVVDTGVTSGSDPTVWDPLDVD